MKTKKLPSETLAHPVRRVPWIVGGVLAAAAIVSAVTFGPAVAAQLGAFPSPSPSVTVAQDTGPTFTASELASIQAAADAQQATIAAGEAAAVKAAADAAAAQVAAQQAASRAAASQSNTGGLPAGAIVPSIPGTTSPDTTKCASGSASNNASGVAVCD